MTTLATKIPFSGFYNTSHDAMFDSWLEYEQEVLTSEHGATDEQISELGELFYSEIKWQAVHVEYCKAYCNALVKLIADASRKYKLDDKGERYLSKPFELQPIFIEMTSPREYNFETDCMYCAIPLEQLQYMLNKIPADDWRAFVESKCTSYDGFVSFYPSDYDSWEKALTQWGEARLGMILEAYLIHILADESTSDIEEALAGHVLIEDYSVNGDIHSWIWENASDKFTTYYNSLRID